MGSLIALECAARHAAERIALIGTAYPMQVSEAFLEAARKNQHAAFDMDTIWGMRRRCRWAVIRTRACGCTGHAGAPAPARPRRPLQRSQGLHDYSGGFESAAKVKCPTLFILGRRDVMTPPRSAQQIVDKIRDAKLVTIGFSGPR